MSIYSEPGWDDVRPSFDEFSFCSNFACCGLRLDMHSLISHFEDAHVLIIDSHGHCVRPCSSWDERTDPLVLAHTLSKISAPSPVTTLLSTPASKGLTRLVVGYPHAGPMRRRPTTAISGALDDLFIKPPPPPVLTNRVVPNATAATAPYLLSPPLSEDDEEETPLEMGHGDNTTPTSWSSPRPLPARSPSPSILASSQVTSSLQSPASSFETDSANVSFSPPCTPISASPAMLSSSFSSPLTPASSVLSLSPSSSSSSSSVSCYSPKHTNSCAYIHPSFITSSSSSFNRYPTNNLKQHHLLPLPKEKLHKPKPRRKDRSSANRRNSNTNSGYGNGGGRSRRSNAREKRFRCPRTGCTKSYLNPNGLKYHLEKGTCVMEEDVEPVFAPSPVECAVEAAGFVGREASLGVDDELLALVSSPVAERRRRGDAHGYDAEKEESADDDDDDDDEGEEDEDEEMLPSSLSSPSLSPVSTSSSPLPVYFY